MSKFLSRATAVLTVCLGLQHVACGADTVYAYDGFNYTVGSALAGQDGGFGWDGAWASAAGPNGSSVVAGLGYSDSSGQVLATQGGAIQTNASVFFAQETRGTAQVFGQAGDSVWVSFLVQQSAAPSSGVNYAGAALGQGLTFGSNAMYGGISAASAGVGGFYVNSGISTNIEIPASSVSFLVLRFDFAAAGNDAISLWVNPDLGAAPGTPHATGSFRDYASAFNGITLAHGDFRTFVFDELRIGSSYASVASVVPEPQAIALMLAGLIVVTGHASRSRKRIQG